MAVEKTLRLESTERFPLSHRHDDEDCRKFHQGLLRRDLGFCLFSSWNGFDSCFAVLFYAAAATVFRLLLWSGSYTSPLTHR